MARYIDADKLCEALKSMASVQPSLKQSTILGVVSSIENTPTADVVEVRHGEWKQHGLMNPRCSLCNSYNIEKSRYCPNCGAKMDGGKQ